MQLEDGTGNAYKVKIDKTNRLHVDALVKTAEHQANHSMGKSYAVNFSATPAGAGDCFFYMKNEDDLDIVAEGMSLYLPAAEYVDIVLGDEGTPVGGGAVTPVNLNGGSGNEATGTFQDGNDITGVSGGSVAYRIYKLASTGSEYINFEQDLILPKNSVFTLYVQTGTTALAGYVDFFYAGVT
jgi:hypothetical protein